MQAKIIQYLIPIICVVLLAFAAAAGGSAWGWNRGVAAEQAKLAKERANMAQREKDIATAEAKWQGMVQVESTKFAQTAMELAAARVLIDQLGENDRVEIARWLLIVSASLLLLPGCSTRASPKPTLDWQQLEIPESLLQPLPPLRQLPPRTPESSTSPSPADTLKGKSPSTSTN